MLFCGGEAGAGGGVGPVTQVVGHAGGDGGEDVGDIVTVVELEHDVVVWGLNVNSRCHSQGAVEYVA